MSDPSSLISNNHFHHRLDLQETSHGPLTISYTDVGDPQGPVLLYIPGMFASRYLGIPLHTIAERAGVRMLVIDRPGMGASTDVPSSQRISAWVEIFPRVISHLGISRVNLVSHSAGTLYLFNTWARCRDIVGSVVCFLAPWVDPAHSRITSMQIAQWIPEKAFVLWHHIPRFVVTQASPVLASSGVLLRHMSVSSGIIATSITTTNSSNSDVEEQGDGSDISFLNANFRRMERDYGVPHEESAELNRLAARAIFDKNTVGANGEALQCLRKGERWDWGVCEDYAGCARMLAEMERERERRGQGRKVTVRAYFAATDALVGRKGQEYFEQCWRAPGVQEEIGLISRVIAGSDHDTLVQSVEVWEEVLQLVRELEG